MNLPPRAQRRAPSLFSVCEEISNRPDLRGDRFACDLSPDRADFESGVRGDLLFVEAVLFARERAETARGVEGS